MIRFSKEKVLLLHQLMAEATGGSVGLRDEALLESALESVYSTFGGQELYPSKEEKAARLGYNLVRNHAFVDGNKRIGMYVMLTFLEVNGIPMAILSYSLSITERAMLSRAAAGIRGQTLIINLPGSPKAVEEALLYILPSLKHGLEIMLGLDSECARPSHS